MPWPSRALRPVDVGGFGEAESRKLADGERGQVVIQLRAGDGTGQHDRCPRLGQRSGQRDRVFGDTYLLTYLLIVATNLGVGRQSVTDSFRRRVAPRPTTDTTDTRAAPRARRC